MITERKPKAKKVYLPPPESRNLEFVGDHKTDSILLGDYGDAKLTARGTFNLSGIALFRKSTLEIYMEGAGSVVLNGRCKNLLIQNISGDCTLDLTDLACKKIRCLSAIGKATIILGRTKEIEQMILGPDVIVRYADGSLLSDFPNGRSTRMVHTDAAA